MTASKTSRLNIPVPTELYLRFLSAFSTRKARRRAVKRINTAIARLVLEQCVQLTDAAYLK